MSWKSKIANHDCELCPLHEGTDNVCIMGSGSRKSTWMIVGEAPGAAEEEGGKPFIGPAGQRLRETLVRAGLDPEDAYITNVVKCRPDQNHTPSRNDAKLCAASYLSKEIDAVRPEFVLVLGNTALQGVAGRSGITEYRGQTLVAGDRVLFPTFHPSATLRNPKLLPQFRSDLERFGRLVRGEKEDKSKDTKTRLVTTRNGLAALGRELKKAKVLSFDIETNDLHEYVEGARIVTLGFTTEVGTAWVVPLWHMSNPWNGNPLPVLKFLKPYLERPGLKIIMHNGKFDARWMAKFGIFIRQFFDTMLAAHLLDENRPKGLEVLCQLYNVRDPWKDQSARTDAYNTPLKRLARYNGRDTDATLQLYYKLRAELKEQPRLARIFIRLMMPASNVLTKVERAGLPLDVDQTERHLATIQAEIDKVDRKLRKLIPEHKRAAFNFNSYQQIAQWLFVDLGLPITELTGTGAPSSKESVLIRLARGNKAPRLLLEYRALVKRAQFYRSWLTEADANGRIHTQYKLFGTVTGRLSSEGPNLQQVPRERSARSCFAAPDGWKIVEADFSQAELRIAAMVAPEPTLLRYYHEGRDAHLEVAAEMTRRPAEWVKASDATGKTEYRKKAKGVNFGYLFGMGWEHFQDYAEENYDWRPTEAEAKDSRRLFFTKFPGFLRWHDRQRRLVGRYGSVNSPIGRVRHLPDVYSADRGVKAEAERQSINSPVQSFASDLMLVSMVLLDDTLSPREAYLVGTVHDAILLLVRDRALPWVVPLVKKTMEKRCVKAVKDWFGCEVTVPLEAEVKVGQAWGTGVEYVEG